MLDQCHNIEKKIPGQIRSVLNVQEMTARALLVDTEALAAAQQAGDVLPPTRSSWTRSTPTYARPRRLARGARAAGRPDGGLPRRAATRSRSRPTASAARRQDGTDDHDVRPEPDGRPSSIARSNRLGARPEEHQLRRRQHLRQGHRGRPGDRRGRRAALGQGLRRRPRHPDRVRPRRAAAGPDARAGRRLPRRRARGRDGRGVRLLPARQGRRRAVDRHRDARAGRRRARRPPAPRLRHRDRDRRRRRGADQGDLRRQGRLGALAASGLPARPRHRRDQGGQPAGGRLHPRRPRHHRVGRHQRGVRGELAVDHRHRRGLHRRAQQGRAVRPGAGRVRRPARGRAPRQGRGPRPDHPRASPRTDRPMVGHFTDSDVVLDFLASRRAPAAGRARHQLPRPLPAHQGQAAGARPARRRRRSRRPIARLRELHDAYREDYQALLRPQRRRRTRPRSAAPTR